MSNLQDIIAITDATVINEIPAELENSPIDYAISCDLMSDVLMFLRKHLKGDDDIEERCLMITGLATTQAIRTAEILDIKYILFVRGKVPTQAVIDQASKDGIVLLTTKHLMFKCCGELYKNEINGIL